MLEDGFMLADGVAIARELRNLAGRARRALQRPLDDWEAHDLLEAIARLESQIEPCSGEELIRWLISLRHQIELQSPAIV